MRWAHTRDDVIRESSNGAPAHMWARGVCRCELLADGASVDMGRVEALLKRSCQALA